MERLTQHTISEAAYLDFLMNYPEFSSWYLDGTDDYDHDTLVGYVPFYGKKTSSILAITDGNDRYLPLRRSAANFVPYIYYVYSSPAPSLRNYTDYYYFSLKHREWDLKKLDWNSLRAVDGATIGAIKAFRAAV